jgi:hypothetical protein
MRPDLYISADVETDGPAPGRHSMLSFGLAIAGRYDGRRFECVEAEHHTFYRELQPAFDQVDPQALAISGLDRKRLLTEGAEPARAMHEASRWVLEQAGEHRPVLVAFPLAFDWLWLQWHFLRFCPVGSPFSFSSCLDMKTMFWMRQGTTLDRAGKGDLPADLRPRRAHTHNALDDAIEQAELFVRLWPHQSGAARS